MLDKKELDKKELRKFGFILATGLVVIFGLFFPYFWDYTIPKWPWVAGLIFVVIALLLPLALRPVYVLWMKIGHVLGWINTRIILSVIFYVIFSPVAFVLLVLRKDPMCRKLDKDMQTYRIQSVKLSHDRLEKPF